MRRVLQFLTTYIAKGVLESKLNVISNAFRKDEMLHFDDVPAAPGVYIMVAKECKFIYPKKKSPVFYIGTSNNLNRRLKDHLRLYKLAQTDYKKNKMWNYSRYNYAVAFGADIYYMRITGRENEKSLESKAMEGFYDRYGAIPVGNGAFAFRQ